MIDLSPWAIYWILQLDIIRQALAIILALLTITLAICISEVFCSYATEEYKSKVKQLCSILFGFVILIGMMNIFLPSSKTVATMLIVPPIINNEQVQQIPNELLTLVRSVIKEHTPKENK